MSDDHKKRFNSYGWDYLEINGHNDKEIYKALKKTQNSKNQLPFRAKLQLDMVRQINLVKPQLMEVR